MSRCSREDVGVPGLAIQTPDVALIPAVKLKCNDFWPACLLAEEGFTNAVFERFDTLLPRANAWLRHNRQIEVIKCETLERRIASPEQLATSNPKFELPDQNANAYWVKGLRVWYSTEKCHQNPMLTHACQLGYRNFTPRCLDLSGKHPVFQDLSTLYNALNEELIEEKPLEGRVVTVETVGLKLERQNWDGPDINVDQGQWRDVPKYHLIYITRVFYLFECPSYEQVGGSDFLPDHVGDSSSGSPQFSDFHTALAKVNAWLEKVKDIRVTNIQTLETALPGLGKADKINTSSNFIAKADTVLLIRFIRVSYVRPKFGLPPDGLIVPKDITYKVFVPAVVSTTESSPEFEPTSSTWDRVLNWLQNTDRQVVGAEVVCHPLPLIVRKKDCGEATVLKGLWVFPSTEAVEGNVMQRLALVEIIRIYFRGTVVSKKPAQEKQEATKVSVEKAARNKCALL